MTPMPDERRDDDMREFLIFLRSLLLALVGWIEKRYGIKRRD